MKHLAIPIVCIFFIIPIAAQAQEKNPDNRELLQRLAQGDTKVIPALVKQGEVVIPELAKLLRKSGREDKATVAVAIAEIAAQVGPKAREAVPVLCETLGFEDKAAANNAARALGSIGPDAVPLLMKSLQASELKPKEIHPQTIYAVRALGYIGPGAKDAVPAVLAILKSSADPQIRVACIRTLGAVGPAAKDAVKDLLKIAQSEEKENIYCKVHLIVSLGLIGPDARPAVPFLAKTMREADEPHFRMAAMEALTRISPDAQELAPALTKMLKSPDLPRAAILENLARGVPLDKQTLKMIEQLLLDKDARVRLQAAMIVGGTNADHPAVVSVLIESLQESDPKLRRGAAEAIGRLRPGDEAVLEALNSRANDSDSGTRKAVAEALAKLKKK